MENRNKEPSWVRILKIIASIILEFVDKVLRLVFVFTLLALFLAIFGSIVSLIITIVTVFDDPALSFAASFGIVYVEKFILMMKIMGVMLIILLMVIPFGLFFDD